jgi:hypothetical protein
MKENDEIRMPNAELMTKSKGCGLVCHGRQGLEYAKVERVVLNALEKSVAPPPDICAFGDHSFIVFGEADPPLIA